MGKNKPRSDKRLDSHEPWGTVTAKEGRASTGEGRGTLELLADVQAADLEMITHPEKGRGHNRRLHSRAAFLPGGCKSQMTMASSVSEKP